MDAAEGGFRSLLCQPVDLLPQPDIARQPVELYGCPAGQSPTDAATFASRSRRASLAEHRSLAVVIDARTLIGSHDVVLLTLDTLRYDVAQDALGRGQTPHFAARIGPGGWERRHSPASFTYAAHHAFFAGFLPTPATTGPHPRMFAVRFAGSETTTEATVVFDAPTIIDGFRQMGYRTICIGGVGFFNRLNPLGTVLPSLFEEAHWDPSLGVTERRSTEHQVELACARLEIETTRRVFLFLNVSAIHQPNRFYCEGAVEDSIHTQAAALAYVDAALPPLFSALRRRGPSLWIACSDHGTAYGEDGFRGHRLAHPVVWDVPYAEWIEPSSGAGSQKGEP